MEEKYLKCHACGIGEIIIETFEEFPYGERTGTYEYSCGHRHHIMVAPGIIHLHDASISTKLKSVEKIGNKSRYEIDEMCKKAI